MDVFAKEMHEPNAGAHDRDRICLEVEQRTEGVEPLLAGVVDRVDNHLGVVAAGVAELVGVC